MGARHLPPYGSEDEPFGSSRTEEGTQMTSAAPSQGQPKVGPGVADRAPSGQPVLHQVRRSQVYDKDDLGSPHSGDQDS